MPDQTRLIVAAILLVGASFAGALHGTSLNQHDEEALFYLTNPDGPAGDFAATRAVEQSRRLVCAGQSAAVAVCGAAAPVVAADSRLATLMEE